MYNSARLKALRTFGEAGRMVSIDGKMNGQPSAKDFVNNVYSKYAKITKVCNRANQCNFPDYIKKSNAAQSLYSDNVNTWGHLNNNMQNGPATNYSTYVQTADGFSAKVFYNPDCASDKVETCGFTSLTMSNGQKQPKASSSPSVYGRVCINVIYDMNGTKAPNHVGEDIGFVSVFFSGYKPTAAAPGILPYDIAESSSWQVGTSRAQNYCSSLPNSKGRYTLPTVDELSSVIINRSLLGANKSNYYSSTFIPCTNGVTWTVWYQNGSIYRENNTGYSGAYCIRH